jgi:nucleotide-binding universal stress UspA family protein
MLVPTHQAENWNNAVYHHILFATDGSDLALKAVDHGLTLARALNAKVTAITATESWTSIASGEMGMAFPIDRQADADRTDQAEPRW